MMSIMSSLLFRSSLYTGQAINIMQIKSCVPFPVRKAASAVKNMRCTYIAHSRALSWSRKRNTDCSCAREPQNAFLLFSLSPSPSLLSSFLFLIASFPFSLMYILFLTLDLFISALLLWDHTSTSPPTHSSEPICCSSRNISVMQNKQTNKSSDRPEL